MKIAAYEGVVDGGTIRLKPEIRLPDKTRVYVVIPESEDRIRGHIHSPRLVHRDQISDFEKEVIEAAPDAGV